MTPEEDELIIDFILSNFSNSVEIIDWEIN
jgi:hypothetical protein